MQNLAEVHLWGHLVGALAYDEETRISRFEYAPQWLALRTEIAPLHMPGSTGIYQFTDLNPQTYRGLPAVFSDTLPDDFGNSVINAWLVRNGRDVNSFNPIERLLYSGKRGMGALEYQPAIRENSALNQQMELESLVAMAQQILDQRAGLKRTVDIQQANDDAMSALFQVGTSAGGARAKALVALNAQRTEIRSGQVDAAPGFEHFLLKFDGVEEHKMQSEVFGDPQGFGRMEYAYYLMARDCGIDISPSELLIDGSRAHFITRRFDRAGNRKLHYASFCAMDHADYKKPGSYSYEQLLAVARQLRLPRQDAVEIFRRMVFNVIARNHDDHSKNTGFVLDSMQASWRLAPAFDLAYSYKKDSPWVNAHQMSLNGKRDNFTRADLMAVANLIGNFNQQAKQIIDQVQQVVSRWSDYADSTGVFDNLASEIKSNQRLSI